MIRLTFKAWGQERPECENEVVAYRKGDQGKLSQRPGKQVKWRVGSRRERHVCPETRRTTGYTSHVVVRAFGYVGGLASGDNNYQTRIELDEGEIRRLVKAYIRAKPRKAFNLLSRMLPEAQMRVHRSISKKLKTLWYDHQDRVSLTEE